MREWWNDYKVDVPEGSKGPWTVERFEVTEDGASWHNLRVMMQGAHGREVFPGTYTRLMHATINDGRFPVMSDTPAEIADHLDAIHKIRAYASKRDDVRVLIHGLGLGLVVKAALACPGVAWIDVVEIDQDVIDLIASHYDDVRLHVRHGDALTYTFPRGAGWDIAWHDIWPSINSDHLPDVARLKRRYGRRVRWQGAWCEGLMRRRW